MEVAGRTEEIHFDFLLSRRCVSNGVGVEEGHSPLRSFVLRAVRTEESLLGIVRCVDCLRRRALSVLVHHAFTRLERRLVGASLGQCNSAVPYSDKWSDWRWDRAGSSSSKSSCRIVLGTGE